LSRAAFVVAVDAPNSSRQGASIETARDGMPVIAIMGDDVVLRLSACGSRRWRRFFADVEMKEAADLALLVSLPRALFEAAHKNISRYQVRNTSVSGGINTSSCG
jgi:hypothetical protein